MVLALLSISRSCARLTGIWHTNKVQISNTRISLGMAASFLKQVENRLNHKRRITLGVDSKMFLSQMPAALDEGKGEEVNIYHFPIHMDHLTLARLFTEIISAYLSSTNEK
jgi:hypothetical protein